MSNGLDSCNVLASEKELLDIRKVEGNESNISVVEKVLSLVYILMNHPKLFPYLLNLKRLCNNRDLVNGHGVYKFYRLKGTNFRPGDITLDTDKELIEFDSKDPEIHKLIFSNPYSVNYLFQQGLKSLANNQVRETLHKISDYLVKSISVQEESQANLTNALIHAKEKGNKIVFLCNHMSHLDAPVLDYILAKKLDLSGRDVRFICGAYMYYNKGVRPFTVGFNTLFVYGPKDFLRLGARLPKKSFLDLLKKFNNSVINTMLENAENEALVLFPYAGRAKKGEDINYSFGCKDKLPNGMKQMLSLENCTYVPLGINGTCDMFGDNKSGGGNMIRNFTKSTPTDVRMSFGKHFDGGEYSLEEINGLMITNTLKAFNLGV